MPRFYFHIIEGGQAKPDREGIDFADLSAARLEALRTLAELTKSSFSVKPLRYTSITVDDGLGAQAYSASVTLTEHWAQAESKDLDRLDIGEGRAKVGW